PQYNKGRSDSCSDPLSWEQITRLESRGSQPERGAVIGGVLGGISGVAVAMMFAYSFGGEIAPSGSNEAFFYAKSAGIGMIVGATTGALVGLTMHAWTTVHQGSMAPSAVAASH
ncbi:MAG: hypothetical protein ACRENS_10915, partial [Candidatus Eiseniibacteriota bacterium]